MWLLYLDIGKIFFIFITFILLFLSKAWWKLSISLNNHFSFAIYITNRIKFCWEFLRSLPHLSLTFPFVLKNELYSRMNRMFSFCYRQNDILLRMNRMFSFYYRQNDILQNAVDFVGRNYWSLTIQKLLHSITSLLT